jgi:xanthine dehydrogenase FAD-binding subunit
MEAGMTDVFLPSSLKQLGDIIQRNPGGKVYSGGTDLLVKMRHATLKPDSLICLEKIPELKGVNETGDHVFIRSGSTISSLIENPIIRKNFPVMVRAMEVFGSPPIRNMGTLGGNIVTASPAGNTLPPLYVLDAAVEIWSREGQSDVPINRFIVGPGKTRLKSGEIVYGIRINKCSEYNLHHFKKVGQRNAMAIAVVSLAAVLKINKIGIIEKARLAWGAVGPTVLTSSEIDAAFTGRHFTASLFQEVAPLIDQLISPISDVRADADYRRQVSANLVKQMLSLKLNEGNRS